jgi:hypothetical protein
VTRWTWLTVLLAALAMPVRVIRRSLTVGDQARAIAREHPRRARPNMSRTAGSAPRRDAAFWR